MWRYTAASILFILFTHFENINGWWSFTINLNNVSSTSYFDKYDVNLTIMENSLNIYFKIKEEIANPMVRVEAFFQSPDTRRYTVEIMNRTVNLCKIFSNPLYEPLIQIFYRIGKEYGDVPESCPLKKKSYRLENLTIDPERLPPYLPERKGYVGLIFYRKEKDLLVPIVQTTLFFEIKSKAVKRFEAKGKN